MKWQTTSYLENRIFDSLLVKEQLLNKINTNTNYPGQRRDFRQFLDTYVISI